MEEMIADTKKWFGSSTIWLNIVGVVIIALQLVTSTQMVVDPEIQALILAILNILNRFRTKQPIKV